MIKLIAAFFNYKYHIAMAIHAQNAPRKRIIIGLNIHINSMKTEESFEFNFLMPDKLSQIEWSLYFYDSIKNRDGVF